MSATGAAVMFCPLSNLFLGSGLFRLGRATDPKHRVKMSFGTDMGGGNRFSMINVLDDAYKVGMCNNTLLDGSLDPGVRDLAEAERNKLSPYAASGPSRSAARRASTSTTGSVISSRARRPISSPSTRMPAKWRRPGTSP